jgi:hypothetical protein
MRLCITAGYSNDRWLYATGSTQVSAGASSDKVVQRKHVLSRLLLGLRAQDWALCSYRCSAAAVAVASVLMKWHCQDACWFPVGQACKALAQVPVVPVQLDATKEWNR